jgi:hypothetical protein
MDATSVEEGMRVGGGSSEVVFEMPLSWGE